MTFYNVSSFFSFRIFCICLGQDDGVAQWVPVEWLDEGTAGGALLLDNVLHRAPHPTTHLIRREDLESVKRCYGDVASLLERNSQYIREVQPPLVLKRATVPICREHMSGTCPGHAFE